METFSKYTSPKPTSAAILPENISQTSGYSYIANSSSFKAAIACNLLINSLRHAVYLPYAQPHLRSIHLKS